METWARFAFAAGLFAALSGACSNDGASADSSTGGATDGLPDGSVSCTNDARLDAYTEGLEKQGINGALSFRLEKSEPGPPAKGNNTLTVSITSLDGEAPGALGVTLKMPDHGHESPTVPTVTFDAESSSYTLSPVNLFMAGVWQITLSAYGDTALRSVPIDSASFFFCIEG